MTLVIDASAAIAWTFEDEHTPAVLALASRVAEEGACVAAHFKLEYANAMLAAVRRKRATFEKVRSALASIDGLNLEIDEHAARVASGRIVDLARKFDLTVYDAAYLELALRIDADLASLDKDLASAARKEGVALVLLA